MKMNWILWHWNKKIECKSNEALNDSKILKFGSIHDNLFLLTTDFNLLFGKVDLKLNCVTLTRQPKLKLKDLDCYGEHLYTVDFDGTVHKRRSDLEVINEIPIYDELKGSCQNCIEKVAIKKIFTNKFGVLFISDSNQLWGSGFMPQVGITSETPKLVNFFRNKRIYDACVGSDFAAVIVSKHNEFVDNYESSALTSSCSHCSISSPVSENNSLSSSCPLGLKVFDNSLEKLSISSIEEINKSNEEAAEKNIIFRNTEAAKQFLTSKISWMSSAGEEYLIEYTEKPTRIIKENMTNVASLVYEGVKSVKSTLSRHVSGSSDCNEPVTSNSNGNIAQTNNLTKINSTENLLEYYDAKSKHLLQTGADLLNTEVWTWGVIVKGLIGDNQLQKERPIKVTKLINIGAKKISAAGSHLGVWTLDGRAFVWGCNVHNQVTYESRVDFVTPKYLQQEVRSRDVACGNSHTVVLTNFFDVIYLGAQAEKPEIIYNFVPKCGTNEEEFGNRHILCFENYTILNERRYFDKILVEFLNEEQKALEEFLAINSGLIKPSLKKIDMSDHYGLYEDFTESFTNVVNMFSANINSIFEGIVDEIIFIKYANECVLILQTYLLLYNNILSIDGIKYISKIIDIPDFITNLRSNVPNKEELISTLLLIPYQRVDSYITFINNQPTTHEAKYKWETFKEEQETKSHEALKTKDFWISAGKLLENLKQPERRLVRDSNNHPIYLLNSGRFSSHWFILLNDIFIHVNGSTLNIHELATLWIDLKEDICQICFKTPEENFTLFTNTPEEKIEWFHVLQNTIKGALKKTDALQPPLIRNASYTFMKNAFYKGAKYTGRWNNGIMHGPGEIVWKNGQSYNGEFCSNQLCGFGRMLIPNVGIYEGEWKENLQNGFGVLDYFNNEVYKGYFKDGFPHGHGILRKGNFNTATASVYIGEWQLGAKSGYGIMDDITSGEKYLGNWQDNKKQGNGLIVTSDGAYYEGTFQQDNFLGNGLMILEDGTYYEGDFRGIGQLSGKGRLTLKSGHVIEGNLHGNWSGTVKISSSTLRKLPIDGVPSVPDNFEKLCTHVDDKWKALFQYCYQILGVNENTKNDIKKVWDNVAVCLSNSHQIYVRRFKGDKNVENSLKNLDIIPPYGRENLDLANYTELKQYLSNAFQSQLHPLGILLNDLCVAYTATYGGMVAHPLLLTHAVSELHSIIKRLYEIIRILFPALPMHEKEKLIKTTRGDEIVGFRSLLYPIILPRIYSSLFTLYALKNKQQELMYSKRLMEWNKHSDSTLLNFFSGNFVIHQIKFENTEIFSEAIETLQQIKTTFSPTEKLLVIKETMQKMTPFAKEHLGTNYVWNMDDLFPIFLFVVIRARILDLGSEIDFMENFMEPSWEQGELGLMFTTLKACYHQILLENSSVT